MIPSSTPKKQEAAPAAKPSGGGRWFSHRLFGMCGQGGVCPPGDTGTAQPVKAAPQPATPRWRGDPLAPKKAA
ncbi:MAG TPA: hypothetical protein VF552_03780 [Allosphingosinicella sp.]|jgi:hypothetical protein